jgi:SAM-dependent methyltransferase
LATNKLAKQVGRRAFGDDPAGYHDARPAYPEWVYRTLSSRCGLRNGSAVFEIGAGTGTASCRLLELGADPLVAIEPDARLAEFLRATNPHKALSVIVSPFEEAVLEARAFDLGVGATVFHWLDENPALERIASLLRPGGWWAAIWNEFGDDQRQDPFHEATKDLLAAPESPSAGERGVPFSLDTAARLAAIERTCAFDIIEHKADRWCLTLDADRTAALYSTYSNVNSRSDRKVVLNELARIARHDFGNRVVRNMVTSLYICRRAD